MKKLLLVNAIKIQDENGTGHSIGAILDMLPDENKKQICIDFLDHSIVSDNIFYVDKSYSPISWMITNRKRTHNSHAAFRENVSGTAERSLRGVVFDFLRGMVDCLPIHIRKNMRDYVERYKPDAIYTCGASVKVLKTAVKLSKLYDIPIILHVMDDWESTLYKASFLSAPFHAVLIHYLKEANKRSKLNFAISQPLCDKLEREYGSKYIPMMNCVDVKIDQVDISSVERLSFLYAGSLSINRWKSLLSIARSMFDILGKGNFNFDLYVPQAQNTEQMKTEFQRFGCSLHDYIPYEEIQKRFQETDILVIAESFDKEFVQFTKYSLSTKIPEYMAAGKPILAFISPACYSYRYLIESGGAAVAGNETELPEMIKRLEKTDERILIAEAGLQFVKKNHSVENKKHVLETVLKEV